LEQHHIPKKVLRICFGGGRPVGRPRNRCEDIIQRDATSLLRIQNWKAAARYKEWRKKVDPKTGRKENKKIRDLFGMHFLPKFT
jgi:hypothetical protein